MTVWCGPGSPGTASPGLVLDPHSGHSAGGSAAAAGADHGLGEDVYGSPPPSAAGIHQTGPG